MLGRNHNMTRWCFLTPCGRPSCPAELLIVTMSSRQLDEKDMSDMCFPGHARTADCADPGGRRVGSRNSAVDRGVTVFQLYGQAQKRVARSWRPGDVTLPGPWFLCAELF